MALIISNRVREASNTTGLGAFTLSGTALGYQTFSAAIGEGNTTYYAIASAEGEWEIGLGTITAGQLVRTTVLDSSNSGSLVDFAAGPKDVFSTVPASEVMLADRTQTLTNKTLTTPVIDGGASGTTAGKLGFDSGAVTYGTGSAQKTLATAEDLAAVTGSSLVGFQQAGGVARTVESKLREISVSVNDYSGSDPSGATDSTAAIQAAMDFVEWCGGGVVDLPVGDFIVAGDLKPRSNVTLRGVGREASRLLIPQGNTTKNTIFIHTDPAQNYENFTIDGVGFVGQWLTTQSEVAANGLVTLKYIKNLAIKNCGFWYSRAFVLNINECDTVTIADNLLEFAPRDMIAVWGTPNVKITGNTLRHNDDDGISVNLETVQADPVRSQITITGNTLEDTGPISTQAPKNVIIADNNIRRAKGAGVLVGIINTSTNSTSSGHGVNVHDNIITDVIDRQWFVDGTQVGSVNNRIYISIYSTPTRAGELPVAPGEVNPATGTVQSPYDFYYKVGSIAGASGSIRAPDGMQVHHNICKRTLPAVGAYSDWGYGGAYSTNGMINHQIPDAVLRGMGVRIHLPFTNLTVENNSIEAGRIGVQFALQSGVVTANRLAKGIVVRRNKIKDFDNYGVEWLPSPVSHQDVRIEGNDFDGDPYFLSTNRGAQGTWLTIAGGVTALRLNFLAGAVVRENTLKNVAAVIEQSGVSALQLVENNLVFGDAAAAGFSVSNKGVGAVPGIAGGEQWWFQYEDSDPTSANYGNTLGANLRNYSGLPSSGKWISGAVIKARNNNILGTSPNQYILLGWLRRNTGSAHVLNTDWAEMRCLTGT